MNPSFATILTVLLIAGSATAADRPNVVYILADDLGYGDLSCYGQEKLKTPNIDRLATEGLKFTNHYSGNTVCSPSRGVLMTGQHSGHCHIRGNVGGEHAAELNPAMQVLPELFQSSGYATGAFGKWGLGQTYVEGAANPLTHGFDEFVGWRSQNSAHTYYPSSMVDNGKEIPLEPGTYIHDVIMDRAKAFVRRSVNEGKPFFCYIPTAIPHAAMQAPPELHEKWRKVFPQFDDRIGTYGAGREEVVDPVTNPIAGFAAMMEKLDTDVGDILALLHELKVDDNTLVIFSSDNGAHNVGGHDPEFWNSTGGLRGRKRDMHEGGIRAPMLARWPGVIQAGRTTNHISGFQDVLPTMADLVGLPIPVQVDGLSFLPTLRGNEQKQSQHDYLYWEFCIGPHQTIYSQAVRQGDWKAFRQTEKPMQLFNLKDDPFEKQDLAREFPERVAAMGAIMEEAHTPLPSQQ